MKYVVKYCVKMDPLLVNLENQLILLTLNLYNNPVVPRNVVQYFITSMDRFMFQTYVPIALAKIKTIQNVETVLDAIKEVFASTQGIFDQFKTEYLRFDVYKKRGLMIEPLKCQFGINATGKECFGFYTPMQWTLKLLLETPGVLKMLETYMTELRREKLVVSNFIQCSNWKKKAKKYVGKLVLPIFLFNDDFEAGNSLGAHSGANKFGAVYFSIPCFPPEYTATLKNIFFSTLYYANDYKEFGNNVIFSNLIKELNDLSRYGLQIYADNKVRIIYFQLGLVVGDNLGMNSLMGYSVGFQTGCPCRICKAPMELIECLTEEKTDLLRSINNYDQDVKTYNPSITGIAEISAFNSVLNFHVCENISLDIMHDIFEGAGCDTMVRLLNEWIYVHRMFSLKDLNTLISEFEKKNSRASNKIPEIKEEHILTKKKLKMSAAESLRFIKYFGFIIARKVDKKKDVLWDMYSHLRSIVCLATSPRYHEGHVQMLKENIKPFLELYLLMFGNLKFKFHNITHLVRALLENGPLINFWCMRYEAKHRILKLTAVSTNSRRNLLKTISTKSQLELAYLRFTESFCLSKPIFDSHKIINAQMRRIHFPNSRHEKIFETNRCSYKGIDYATELLFIQKLGEDDLLDFGQIKSIFIKNEEVFLLMRRWRFILKDFDYDAFLIEESAVFVLIQPEDLPNLHPCYLVEQDNEFYALPKYEL